MWKGRLKPRWLRSRGAVMVRGEHSRLTSASRLPLPLTTRPSAHVLAGNTALLYHLPMCILTSRNTKLILECNIGNTRWFKYLLSFLCLYSDKIVKMMIKNRETRNGQGLGDVRWTDSNLILPWAVQVCSWLCALTTLPTNRPSSRKTGETKTNHRCWFFFFF